MKAEDILRKIGQLDSPDHRLMVKAGIREVVEFVETHIPKTLTKYVGFWQNWESQLKEWDLWNPKS